MARAVHSRSETTNVMSIVMAEFEALRQEISSRSEAQHTLINLNITGVGAITGVVLTQGHGLLMLMLPFITSALGLLFFDHAQNIDRIGRYIKAELWHQLEGMTDGVKLTSYQDWVAKSERRRLPRTIYTMALFLMFAGPAVLGLAFAFPLLSSIWVVILWLAGWLAVAALVAFCYAFLARPFVIRSARALRPLLPRRASNA